MRPEEKENINENSIVPGIEIYLSIAAAEHEGESHRMDFISTFWLQTIDAWPKGCICKFRHLLQSREIYTDKGRDTAAQRLLSLFFRISRIDAKLEFSPEREARLESKLSLPALVSKVLGHKFND